MSNVLVVYASTHGHTGKIAARIDAISSADHSLLGSEASRSTIELLAALRRVPISMTVICSSRWRLSASATPAAAGPEPMIREDVTGTAPGHGSGDTCRARR